MANCIWSALTVWPGKPQQLTQVRFELLQYNTTTSTSQSPVSFIEMMLLLQSRGSIIISHLQEASQEEREMYTASLISKN